MDLVRGQLVDGKYLIGEEIGFGGMATVYAAEHIELGRPVAVKVLRSDLARSRTISGRFSREARAAALLQSEHVARVLDVGVLEGDDDTSYIVMERLHGKDLRSVLKERGPLPPEQVVDWILEACEAVAEAHARGIVHRDLKPANLFLASRDDGSTLIKVLDFGIAKAIASAPADHELTGTFDVLGSPRYMSPEQLRASGKVDARTDVWALGVVMFELLTGTTPFGGGAIAEVHAAILLRAVPRVDDLRNDIPDDLATIVHQCLQKDSDDRFSNLLAMARALAPLGSSGASRSLEAVERWGARTPDDGFVTSRVTEAELDSHDDTDLSNAPSTTPAESSGTDDEAAAAPREARQEEPGQQTATSWDRESRPPMVRPRVWMLAPLAAVGVAVAVWSASSDDSSAPGRASSEPDSGRAPAAVMPSVEMQPPRAMDTTPSAAASAVASGSLPPSSASSAAPAPRRPREARAVSPAPRAPSARPRSTYDDRE